MSEKRFTHCKIVHGSCVCEKNDVVRCESIIKIPEEDLQTQAEKWTGWYNPHFDEEMPTHRPRVDIYTEWTQVRTEAIEKMMEYDFSALEARVRSVLGSKIDRGPELIWPSVYEKKLHFEDVKFRRTGSIEKRKPHHAFLEDPVKKRKR